MSDEHKYYYLKIKEDFFDQPEIKVIERMQNGYKYTNILLKMYLHSLKREGKLMITDYIPYDIPSLAAVVGHDEDTVRVAVAMFKNFELIQALDSGAIFMTQIQNFIGKSTTEADRKRHYRARIEAEKRAEVIALDLGMIPAEPDAPHPMLPAIDEAPVIPAPEQPQVPDSPPLPARPPNCPYDDIAKLYNEICTKLPKVRELTEKRKKAMQTVWKIHPEINYFSEVFNKANTSDFLTGKNEREWKADFDFMVNLNNIVKIVEGKYDNKPENNDPFTPPRNALEFLQHRRAAREVTYDG